MAARKLLGAGLAMAAALVLTMSAAAQQLSDLEPDRPISVQDARPVSYRAISGAVDWSFYEQHGNSNDYGPGFSLLYGAARGLEVGAALRYVTSPENNAARGISSGDLFVHALYGLRTESESWPALAVRADVEFPTGLDSRGTDLHLAGLATRSFDAFRLHGNVLYTRLGDPGSRERRDQWEGIAGIDFLASPRGLTDTLIVADALTRSNRVLGGPQIFGIEAGTRRRIGSQTILFAGAGSELAGGRDRQRLTLRLGLSHIY